MLCFGYKSSACCCKQEHVCAINSLACLAAHPATIHLPPKGHLSLAPQVKRRLLRPCISLTKAVRSEEQGSPEVTVDVDTLTFDRQATLDS